MKDVEQITTKPKNIKILEKKAKGNDINALMQLAEYYEKGEFVEKNYLTAVKFQRRVVEVFQSHSLRLSSLNLINFRAFEDVKIKLCNKYENDSNLTVFFGINGSGKTSILESISQSLSWLVRRITSPSSGGTGDRLELSDINNRKSVDCSSIVTKFQITKKDTFNLVLSRSKLGSKNSRTSQLQEIGRLAMLYKLSNKYITDYNFPLFAFYSVERSVPLDQKDIIETDEKIEQRIWEKFNGYSKSLNGKADFKKFFNWFKYLEDTKNATLNESVLISKEIETLERELASPLFEIKENKSQSKTDIDILNKLKKDKQHEIKQRETKLKEIKESENLDTRKILSCVTEAIYQFMPEFKNLRIQRRPDLDMLVEKNNITLHVSQLSQGEKTLLGLIADISRRLVLLNPSSDNPLEGEGIVLIDEIDLHLHPLWQQKVLPNLTNSFPNIQFIVTTHSPQVITTCRSSELRVVHQRESGDLEIDIPDNNPYGHTSVDALALMNTPARPQLDIHSVVAKYEQLVRRGKRSSSAAKELKNTIENEGFHISEDDIELWELLSQEGE